MAERNLSHNTQSSYRDTLMLLLPFTCRQGSVAIDRMTVEDITPAMFANSLITWSVTANAVTLPATKDLRPSIRWRDLSGCVCLSTWAWCAEMRGIPFKKTAKTVIGYLEKAEMDALLNEPDRRTNLGRATMPCCFSCTIAALVLMKQRN